jgi:predicted phosphodiesterase
MKYAILSDIHGNTIALDAVLNALSDVDAYLLLGDYCALGANPVGVLERICKLPNAIFVRGNTERYITRGYEHYPTPTIAEAVENPERVFVLAEMSRSFAWTQGMITAAGYFDWVVSLPLEQRLSLPDGSSVLMVHAAPNDDDNEGIVPIDSDEIIAKRFACEEDIVMVGHTHWPQERRVNGKLIINAGSIGNPVGEEVFASYVTLEADENGYRYQFHKTYYDVEAALAQLTKINHPSPNYISRFYKGQIIPNWYKEWRKQ